MMPTTKKAKKKQNLAKPSAKLIYFDLPTRYKAQVDKEMVADQRTRSTYLRRLVRASLDRLDGKPALPAAPVPSEKKEVRVFTRVSEDDMQLLNRIAKANERPRSWVVRNLVINEMGKA
jgi:hypothetical protein